MKIRIDKADTVFSQFIRIRDRKCMRCGSPVKFKNGLPVSHQASHFQSRRKEATRFDEENVDCLCAGCHLYLTANPAEHYKWQVGRKGQAAVDAIVLRSNLPHKKDRKLALLYWQERLKEKEWQLVFEYEAEHGA